MDTTNTKKIVIKYLGQAICMVIFYFILLKVTDYSLNNIPISSSTILYIPSLSFYKSIRILLIIYALFSYLANNFLLDLFHRAKTKQLVFSMLADLLIIPLEVWIMIIYNNHTSDTIAQLPSLYNATLITALFIIKNIIAIRLLSPKKVKTSAGTQRA